MILIIDTTKQDLLELKLKSVSGQIVTSLEAEYKSKQSQELLISIEKLLQSQKLKLKDLTAIEVVNGSGGFSNLRLGVATANALAYSLGIPLSDDSGHKKQLPDNIEVVTPDYNCEPHIG